MNGLNNVSIPSPLRPQENKPMIANNAMHTDRPKSGLPLMVSVGFQEKGLRHARRKT
jgi:hypothetical protein